MQRFSILQDSDFHILCKPIKSIDDTLLIMKFKDEFVFRITCSGYASITIALDKILPLMLAVRNGLPLNPTPFEVWSTCNYAGPPSTKFVKPRCVVFFVGSGCLSLNVVDEARRSFYISGTTLKIMLPLLAEWINENTSMD